MAKDIKIDFINGKIVNDFVEGKERIIQQIKIATRIWKEHWEYDTNYGISYAENFNNSGIIAQEVREMIEQVEGVVSVVSLSISEQFESTGYGHFFIDAIIELENEIITITQERMG